MAHTTPRLSRCFAPTHRQTLSRRQRATAMVVWAKVVEGIRSHLIRCLAPKRRQAQSQLPEAAVSRVTWAVAAVRTVDVSPVAVATTAVPTEGEAERPVDYGTRDGVDVAM